MVFNLKMKKKLIYIFYRSNRLGQKWKAARERANPDKKLLIEQS